MVGLVVIAAIALSACGSDDEAAAPVNTATVAKRAFVKDADSACKEATASFGSLSGQINDALTFGDSDTAADAADELSSRTSALAGDIRELPQPDVDAEVATAFVEALDERAEIMGSLADAIRSSDQAETDRLAEESASATDGIGSTDSAAIAVRFGFEICR